MKRRVMMGHDMATKAFPMRFARQFLILGEDFEKLADDEAQENEEALECKCKEATEVEAIAAAAVGGSHVIVLLPGCGSPAPKETAGPSSKKAQQFMLLMAENDMVTQSYKASHSGIQSKTH